MDPPPTIIDAIRSRSARIGVIGAGYVGLPLVGLFHEAGFPVVAFDTDPGKIGKLDAGECYIRHLGDRFFRALAASDRFGATADFDRLAAMDAVIVCVPTPLAEGKQPDLAFVRQTGREIGKRLRRGQLVSLESTTYPGTTRDEFLPELLAAGADLRPDEDFFLCYSPERENPGDPDHRTPDIPKLVGAIGPRSLDAGTELYASIVRTVVPVSNCEVAEAAKLLENVFRAVNIALVNELKVILDAMGIDVWEVVRASATKPFGFMPFEPGPGLGGHCIPIDPFYLAWKGRQVGRPSRFIELAGEVNEQMPEYVVERLVGALRVRGRDIHGARVLVLGIAYKPNIDDPRESPSFEIIERLEDLGASADYSDPHIPRTWKMRRHDLGKQSVEPKPDVIASYDAVVIATAHDAFDYPMIAGSARLVIDTRDAMRRRGLDMGDRLVRA